MNESTQRKFSRPGRGVKFLRRYNVLALDGPCSMAAINAQVVAMTISRRGFIAAVALTGVAVPGALYVQRQRDADAFPETPGEAVVELADTRLQQLGDILRGIWRWTAHGKDAQLLGMPDGELELFLDVASNGRGLRGYLDTADRLRSEQEPRYRVMGDLLTDKPGTLRWRLFSTEPGAGRGGAAGAGQRAALALGVRAPARLTPAPQRQLNAACRAAGCGSPREIPAWPSCFWPPPRPVAVNCWLRSLCLASRKSPR